MDRVIVYPASVPQDTDVLSVQRNAMIAHGYLEQMVTGQSQAISGLYVTPVGTSAPMSVQVGPGSMSALSTIDSTPYGSLSADANPLIKLGVNAGTPTVYALTAPTTSGQSVYYVIAAQYQEADTTPIILPYYNAQNPASPLSGPNGTSVAQNTVRAQSVALQLIAGTAAASPTVPATPSGWTALADVLVPYGLTQITQGNIINPARTSISRSLGNTYYWTAPGSIPAQDIFLNVGDKVVITMNNLSMPSNSKSGLPLSVQTTQGLYKWTYTEYASTRVNTGCAFYPNNNFNFPVNTLYADFLQCSTAFFTSVATSATAPPGWGVYAPANFFSPTPVEFDGVGIYQSNVQNTSGFGYTWWIDTNNGPTGNAGDLNEHGPLLMEGYFSTATACKFASWTAWQRGTVCHWRGRWDDSTTAWTSLGTWAGGNAGGGVSSGTVIIERLA